jgi:hypothetical protein
MTMKPRLLLWIALTALIIVGYAVYRQRTDSRGLNVDPHAAEEIEKARRR